MKFEKTYTTDIRRIICAAISGIALSMIFVFGYSIEKYGSVDFSRALTYIFLFLLTAFFFGIVYMLLGLQVKISDTTQKSEREVRRFFVLVFLSMSFIWALWYLSDYPGYYAYDAPWQWQMYADQAITEHHPVLHTLVLGKFMELSDSLFGNLYRGVAVYTLLQVVFTVFAFSYALTYMYRRPVSKKLLVFAYLWFGFAPTVIVNGLATTKDSVFAWNMVLFFVLSHQMLEEGERFFRRKRKMALWIFVVLLCGIMRNNAIYVLVPFLLWLLYSNRLYLKKYLALFGITAALYLTYSLVLVPSVTVSRLDTEEFLSIPLQQVCWTYMNEREVLTEEEIAFIEASFSEEAFALYNPRISDGVKFEFDIASYKTDSSDFIALWFQLLEKDPAGYVNAFLVNNEGLWYPWPTYVAYKTGEIAYCICHSYNPVINHSYIPLLGKYLSLFETSDFVCENALTEWLFAPGTWFILFLISFAFVLCKKKKITPFYVFVFLFWLTFLLGPVASVRYVSFVFYMVPLYVWMIYDSVLLSKGCPEE